MLRLLRRPAAALSRAGATAIERFKRTYREEVLDAYLFDSLEQVRAITHAWLETYNTERCRH